MGGETDWPDDYIFEKIAIQGSKSFYRLGGGGGGGCHRLYLQKYCKAYEQRFGGPEYSGISVRKYDNCVKKYGISVQKNDTVSLLINRAFLCIHVFDIVVLLRNGASVCGNTVSKCTGVRYRTVQKWHHCASIWYPSREITWYLLCKTSYINRK